MKLLAALLALVLLYSLGSRVPLQNVRPFRRWQAFCTGRLEGVESGALRYAFVLAPPLLVTAALLWWLDRCLPVLGPFLVYTGALVWCMGPRPLNRDIDEYVAALKGERTEERDKVLQVLSGVATPGEGEENHALGAIFYQAFVRWYGVLFWFALLGPLGALWYRISVVETEYPHAAKAWAEPVYGTLAWAPARITALFYGLLGRFEPAMEAMHGATGDSASVRNRRLLQNSGRAAIGMGPDVEPALPNPAVVEKAQWLVGKVLLLWLALVAVAVTVGSLAP